MKAVGGGALELKAKQGTIVIGTFDILINFTPDARDFFFCLILRNNKTGNKKRATCFVTFLQNELTSEVARFTNHEKKTSQPYLLQGRFERV